MSLEIIITQDGSPTLINTELNASYHSLFGAITESQHIYIRHGFLNPLLARQNQVNLLEIGFGSGLNAFLTMIEARKINRKVHYTSIEKQPLEPEWAVMLSYPDILDTGRPEFKAMHDCAWNQLCSIDPYFSLFKMKADARQVKFPESIDLVYFDAFAPAVSPELWAKALLEELFNSMKPGALLVTFCAKGEVKRRLKQTGFELNKTQGPPGKREITIAIKPT